MNCRHCNAQNPEGNAFCHSCGEALGAEVAEPPPAAPDHVACTRCGGHNRPDRQFCTACGAPLARAGGSQPISGLRRGPDRPPARMGLTAAQSGDPLGTCSNCRAIIDGRARFCKFCGAAAGSAGAGVAGSAGASAPASPGLGYTESEARPRPGAALNARVVVIQRDGSEGGVYPLKGAYTDVGSREGAIVLREDPYLAPRHARIERRGDTFVLLDLGSINGIYVRIRQPTILSDADMILIGQQVLRFEVTSESERHVGPAAQHGVMVFGTPEAPRLARLVQYTTEGLARDVYYMHREETVLGREQADVVFSDDPFLSRRHASVTLQNGGFVLRDLGSSNGTSLRCRTEKVLDHGDQFRVGRHLFRFDISYEGPAVT